MTRLGVLFLVLSVYGLPACADVMYQCVDEDGHKSFSNIKPVAKGPKCTAMNFPDAPTSSVPKSASPKVPTPSNFPKVDGGTQKARDNDRRRILEGELSAEQKSLEEARKELGAQEGQVLPTERIKGGGINGAKVDERRQPYKDKVALHERNIEAIQKELARLQ